MLSKKEIIDETIKMVGDSIMIMEKYNKITPEHFRIPVEYALYRYEQELKNKQKGQEDGKQN